MVNRLFVVSFQGSESEFYPSLYPSDMSFETEMESSAGSGTDYPEYAGSYEIVPKVTAQTLDTAYKVMTDDIVIEAIPSNYGRIAWNGSKLMVY